MKVDIFNTDKKYDIIYADPPWLYRDTLGGNAKMGAMPYPCMTQDEIKNLPIHNLAAKDSVLQKYQQKDGDVFVICSDEEAVWEAVRG